MPSYYAQFKQVSSAVITRENTRIYFCDVGPTSQKGKCLGVFFLKNPGTANPIKFNEFGPLKLDNDKTLPWIANVCLQVFNTHNINRNNFVRVMNLISICDPDLEEAVKQFKLHPDCFEEIDFKEVPFIFFGWEEKNN